MADYDLEQAFEAIENELINSMIRNMEHHRVEEITEGFEWTQWQAEELRSLEAYRKSNRKKYNKKFKEINEKIEYGIRKAHGQGRMDEEIRILEAIKKGFVTTREPSAELQGSFFGVNDRKLNALVEATMHDMKKAETAMLRMADDQYRKTIFNAQVYANTGAGTYEQAIDMATKDFRARGINCIEYKNGARVNIASYAAMAIRTANTRAYLQGEGTKRQEWGISTVIVGRRGHACLKCLKWVGKVLIDDVWSGGKKDDGPYPLMSTAMSAGLYHPNCKDTHTTYFSGITEVPKPLTRKEVDKSLEMEKQIAEQNYVQRQQKKWQRMADTSLDEDNRRMYQARADEWAERAKEFEDVEPLKQLEDRNVPVNKNGEEIQFNFKKGNENRQNQIDVINRLSKEYKTRLKEVTSGAVGGGGDVDMSGSRMRLSDSHDYTAIHEFAHTLANSSAQKYGLTDDEAFWKEIKSTQRKYMKDVGDDTSRWISSYEHGARNVDEFMAEAFTQAKMKQLGLPLPSKYGNDFTYSEKVLETVDKYFGKSVVKTGSSDIINNIEIDELTPCLRRLKDDKIVDTMVYQISPTRKEFKDWEFDWTIPEKKEYEVFELIAEGDRRTQGMVALKPDNSSYAIHVDIVEAAPHNNPHNKLCVNKEYSGVGGHLFAEAVKQSYEAGYDGAVYFTAKTDLIKHYEKELGAVLINPRQRTMFIDEDAAKILFERYYGGKK